MSAPIVYFDVAGPDPAALRDFYSRLSEWDSDEAGQFTVSVSPLLGGALREDPSSGSRPEIRWGSLRWRWASPGFHRSDNGCECVR